VARPAGGHAADHGHRPLLLLHAAEARGRDDFRKIPNGTGGVEDRMGVLWHHGVRTGKLTPSQFVAATSTNARRSSTSSPKKGAIMAGRRRRHRGVGPAKTRTISAKTHHQNIDFNIYEGMEITGNAAITLSRGMVVWENDQLQTVRGRGRYVNRPCFAPFWDTQARRNLQDTRVPAVRKT
jgi:dihydropyrimidinase